MLCDVARPPSRPLPLHSRSLSVCVVFILVHFLFMSCAFPFTFCESSLRPINFTSTSTGDHPNPDHVQCTDTGSRVVSQILAGLWESTHLRFLADPLGAPVLPPPNHTLHWQPVAPKSPLTFLCVHPVHFLFNHVQSGFLPVHFVRVHASPLTQPPLQLAHLHAWMTARSRDNQPACDTADVPSAFMQKEIKQLHCELLTHNKSLCTAPPALKPPASGGSCRCLRRLAATRGRRFSKVPCLARSRCSKHGVAHHMLQARSRCFSPCSGCLRQCAIRLPVCTLLKAALCLAHVIAHPF